MYRNTTVVIYVVTDYKWHNFMGNQQTKVLSLGCFYVFILEIIVFKCILSTSEQFLYLALRDILLQEF